MHVRVLCTHIVYALGVVTMMIENVHLVTLQYISLLKCKIIGVVGEASHAVSDV